MHLLTRSGKKIGDQRGAMGDGKRSHEVGWAVKTRLDGEQPNEARGLQALKVFPFWRTCGK